MACLCPKMFHFSAPSFDFRMDDVVRKDNFRPDVENIRDMASSSSGATSGLYDFQGGQNKEASFADLDSVPSELIYLREGRFNQTERKVLQKKIKTDLQNEADESAKTIAQEGRQARIDNILGIESDISSGKE